MGCECTRLRDIAVTVLNTQLDIFVWDVRNQNMKIPRQIESAVRRFEIRSTAHVRDQNINFVG